LEATMTEAAAHLGSSPLIHAGDFIEWACRTLEPSLFAADEPEPFDLAILNPPYRKLASDSGERRLLRSVGIDATNLYAAFVALAIRLLRPGGQLVAITPRSFCNGPYFKPFRRQLLEQTGLQRVHVFESRDAAFRDAEVLQENVIFHVIKGEQPKSVVLSSSQGVGMEPASSWVTPYSDIVQSGDRNLFIHLPLGEQDHKVASQLLALPATLAHLDVSVSTGRVVDFRARQHLRADPEADTVPLIYPTHLSEGRVCWPRPGGRKPNAIADNEETMPLLLPMGTYVLVKRFTAKEERRRVVASVLTSDDLPAEQVAIENHLNVYHRGNRPLPEDLAWGLAAYLNSTVVDTFFRQFNGHTQVNATDLRSLRYPSVAALSKMGKRMAREPLGPDEIDRLVEAALA